MIWTFDRKYAENARVQPLYAGGNNNNETNCQLSGVC
jgi:hypothetical protein